MSANQRPDWRAQRTIRTLQKALLALVAERGYEAVTVQEIAERANVGRATFYLHFQDKEQFLIAGLEDVVEELCAGMASLPSGLERGLALARLAFVHLGRHRALYQPLLGPNGTVRVAARLRELIADQIAADLQALPGLAPESAVLIPPLAQHTAGALVALLAWWLANDQPRSPEAMAALHLQLVMPGIIAALSLQLPLP